MDLSFLENMVHEVNSTELDPQDKLSDHVYKYDAEEKTLVRADKVAEANELGMNHERISIKDEIPKMTEKAHEINQEAQKSGQKVKDKVLN